jgi:hypothetical protein
VITTQPVYLISMVDVEDMYRVTYVQGESITVHMDERDFVFSRREKMYVANFSDWLVDDQDRVEQLYTGLSLLTVKDKEDLYTRKEVPRALEAGKFLKARGYPSERDALEILHAGNVRNILHSPDDVRRFKTIYGRQVRSRQYAVKQLKPKPRPESSGMKVPRCR